MTTTTPDNRSPQRKAQDEQIAAEPNLAAPSLPANALPQPMESLLRRRRRPVALEGIVENGVVRLLDTSVKLPNHSRVIVVAESAA
jgi:hypothetical protein